MAFQQPVEFQVTDKVSTPGPLFNKQTEGLQQDLMKFRSHEIWVYTFPITLKFDRHLSSWAAEMPVNFQIDIIIITSNLRAWRLNEVWW